jgi:hypothetical protein
MSLIARIALTVTLALVAFSLPPILFTQAQDAGLHMLRESSAVQTCNDAHAANVAALLAEQHTDMNGLEQVFDALWNKMVRDNPDTAQKVADLKAALRGIANRTGHSYGAITALFFCIGDELQKSSIAKNMARELMLTERASLISNLVGQNRGL